MTQMSNLSLSLWRQTYVGSDQVKNIRHLIFDKLNDLDFLLGTEPDGLTLMDNLFVNCPSPSTDTLFVARSQIA